MAYTGLRDLVPLYALYALVVTDAGLDGGGLSLLFVWWSLTGLVAEVPSGALADVAPRRAVLCASSALTACGFAVWQLWPTPAGLALGFSCWGVGGAMVSGTWESLVHDQLVVHGRRDRYAAVIGWGEAAGWVAAVASGGLAVLLVRAGGLALVGWVSVAVMVAHAALTWVLPEPPRSGEDPDGEGEPDHGEDDRSAGADPAPTGWWATLRVGVAEASTQVAVRRTVVLVALATGLLGVEEYFPVVAVDVGVAVVDVPWFMTLVFLGQAGGAVLAGATARWAPRRLAWTMAAGGAALAGGALSGAPLGFVAMAVGYAACLLVSIVLEARLQETMSGRARATVSSASSLLSELTVIVVFSGFALLGGRLPAAAFVAVAGGMLVVQAWWVRGAPAAR